MATLTIIFHKLSDERHALEIRRSDGAREQVECETRSYLMHDLLHYAVEAEAGVGSGFWGTLAAGKTLADMNDRTGMALGTAAGEVGAIEQVVGALSGVTKGRAPEDLVAGIRRYATSLGTTMPGWLTVPFLEAVTERMRRLTGHWRATPHGGAMTLLWPPE
jgi:hypothetical protein